MASTVHVYPADKGWAVKREGGGASRLFPTQKAAVQTARSMMRDLGPSQMIVHGSNGRIRYYATHGLPKIQSPAVRSASAERIRKAVRKLLFERLAADPHPPRV